MMEAEAVLDQDVMDQIEASVDESLGIEPLTGPAVVENRQAQGVQNALAFLSQNTKPPVPRAMKMAVTRGDLKRRLEAIDELHKQLFARHGTGEPGHEKVQRFIDDKPSLGETEAYESYTAELEELMDQTFELPEESRILLYEKGDKYAWKEDMTFEVQPAEALPEALFHLLDAGLLAVHKVE